jgi:acyl-coenzyme A synthetase/AMP-(fatty) acid ligase
MMMSGGFVPLALVEQIRDRLTNEVWISYGSTECSLPAYSRFRTAEDLIWLTPSPDRTVEIVDEGGNLLGPDQPGDLRIPLVDYDAHSYLDDEEATQRFFRDGCFYPGDMAVWRSDGRIRILGRSADVVNIQGMKVPVAPLEQEAQQKLGVETVCIFGGMDDDGQEVLMVAMETDKLPPRAAMEQVAAGFKTFKQVQFRVVKQFPRTVTGLQKIKRIELRQMVFGEQFVRH